MSPRYVTVEYYAEQMSLSPESVRRRIRQGRIRATNIGTARRHHYRIPASELVAAA